LEVVTAAPGVGAAMRLNSIVCRTAGSVVCLQLSVP
jgi:hypothetical protein